MPSAHLHVALAGALASVLAVTTASSLDAQSAAHLGVRGALHTGPTGVQRLTGASAQLDVMARDRVDVRVHAGVASGSRQGFETCGDPTVNCAPREVQIDNRRTTIGIALPVRLSRPGALDLRIVPGLDGHRLDGITQLGVSLGLESRYRRSPASRLEFVAAADVNRVTDLDITADAASFEGTFTRFSVGVRYQLYTRR